MFLQGKAKPCYTINVIQESRTYVVDKLCPNSDPRAARCQVKKYFWGSL